jgi:hypothetical protein
VRYLVTIYNNEETLRAIEGEAREEFEHAHQALQRELTASGELVDSTELSNVDAKVVRTEGGRTLVTDGPFSEAKEWAGGYYLLECADLDRAVEIAGRFVETRYAPADVRRVGSD